MFNIDNIEAALLLCLSSFHGRFEVLTINIAPFHIIFIDLHFNRYNICSFCTKSYIIYN